MMAGFCLTKKVRGERDGSRNLGQVLLKSAICSMLEKQKALSSSAAVTQKQTEQNPSGLQRVMVSIQCHWRAGLLNNPQPCQPWELLTIVTTCLQLCLLGHLFPICSYSYEELFGSRPGLALRFPLCWMPRERLSERGLSLLHSQASLGWLAWKYTHQRSKPSCSLKASDSKIAAAKTWQD